MCDHDLHVLSLCDQYDSARVFHKLADVVLDLDVGHLGIVADQYFDGAF